MWRNVCVGGLVLALVAALDVPAWADVFESQQATDLTINEPSFPALTATRLRMKYSGGQERYNTLIRFDNLDLLVPLEGMKVDSASLALTWREENLEWFPASIAVHKLNKAWSEANANWEEADTDILWDEPGAAGADRDPFGESLFMGNRFFVSIFDKLNYTDGQQFEVELNPAWVQDWIEHPELNYGVVVIMNHAAGSDVTFTSNDDFTDPDAAPLLTVVTGPAGPPPAAPTDLIATADSKEQITLEWTDNAGDETGFDIERSTDGIAGTYSFLATVGPNTEMYEDMSLEIDTEYCYRVLAFNADAGSAYTNNDCATTFPLAPPAAPTALTATADSKEQITLDWIDNAGNEDGFEIERSTEGIGGAYTPLDSVGADTLMYVDEGLDGETEYCYRVRAINADGESAYTDAMCTTTLIENLCPHVLAADFNADCYVNLEELFMLIADWGNSEDTVANLDGDPTVNYADYALLTNQYFLTCGALAGDMDHNCVVDYLDYALLADADLLTLLALADEWLASCNVFSETCTGGSQ